LNIALVPLENGEHAIWLKEVDNALQCYVCSKCNLRVFHNYTSYKRHESCCDGSKLTKKLIASPLERQIDSNFDFNPRNQYLTLTGQQQKYRPTRFYITYDNETMENKIFNEDIENSKNPSKILSYIYPLSVASCAHTGCYITICVIVMTSCRNGLQLF
jgi:hypothetical protein